MTATDDSAPAIAAAAELATEADQPLPRPRSARAHVSASQPTGLTAVVTPPKPDRSR